MGLQIKSPAAYIAAARGKGAGFTLIELMIVIVIVAVLLAVALPAYRGQVVRSHRAEAKSEMLEIASRQEQHLLSDRAYSSDPNDIAYNLPSEVASRYSLGITVNSPGDPPFYEITFTAIGDQAADGNLTLNSEGEKTPPAKWER